MRGQETHRPHNGSATKKRFVKTTAGAGGRSIISLLPATGQNARITGTRRNPPISANGHAAPATATVQNGLVAAGQNAVATGPDQTAPILAMPTEEPASTSLRPIRSAATGQRGSMASGAEIDAASHG